MQHFSASLRELVVRHWLNRNLINASIERETLGRYRGSFFGGLWLLFSPLFHACDLNARFQRDSEGALDRGKQFQCGIRFHFVRWRDAVQSLRRNAHPISESRRWHHELFEESRVFAGDCLRRCLAQRFSVSSSGPWLTCCSTDSARHGAVFPARFVLYCLPILGLCGMFASLGVYSRDASQLLTPW